MAHYRPSNNKEKRCTHDVKICYNDVTIKQGIASPGSNNKGWRPPVLLLRHYCALLYYHYIIITYLLQCP